MLEATWATDEQTMLITAPGRDPVSLPVEHGVTAHLAWLKPHGNSKTQHGGIGIVNTLNGGCFRSLLPFERSDLPCYADGVDPCSGCYADQTLCARFARARGDDFAVGSNGITPATQRYFHARTPSKWTLDRYPARYWRVDSESSTACLSMALGLTQRWAEANPKKIFTGISSDHFHVPAPMLRRAAAAGNIVIGHTVSPWFSVEENRHRFREAKRWQRHGVPTVIWAVTSSRWDDGGYVRRRLREWEPRQVIECPYHTKQGYAEHVLSINPKGGCCEIGIDKTGEYVRPEDAEGKWRGNCHGCKVLCGVDHLRQIRREQ